MEVKTAAQMQRILDLEVILILIAVGVDILIEALIQRDWLAAAVIVAGFAILGGLYRHTLYLDRLFADLHVALRRVFPHRIQASAQDISVAAIADRPMIHVSNFLLSRNFYEKALNPLGYAVTVEFPALSMAALGIGAASDLWIKGDGAEQKIRAAFSASQRSSVDDFYAIALDAGGAEAEAPGPRPERGAGYYAAAVYDPDGYTIEAVFRDTSSS